MYDHHGLSGLRGHETKENKRHGRSLLSPMTRIRDVQKRQIVRGPLQYNDLKRVLKKITHARKKRAVDDRG